MPGICGAVAVSHPHGVVPQGVYQAMVGTLLHRSEYLQSHYANDRGRVRIAAVGHGDLIGAPQAIDGAIVVSYGRLHTQPGNQDGTGNTGASALTPAGNFSLARYDPLTGTLSLRVDRYASEPIFYAYVNGVLYFAPEVKALFAAQPTREIDYGALASFLGSGHFLGNQTLLSNVRKLSGGHELVVNGNGIKAHPYWRFEPGMDHRGESQDLLSKQLGHLVEDSMRRLFHRRADELIFLSGGLDSRAILAGALKTPPEGTPIRTVSWGAASGIPGSDQYVAASIAGRYGLQHRFMSRGPESYGENVRQTLYLIDGQCDVPCMHPGEFQLLASLEAMGVRKVFRGDEAFGWHSRVYSHLGAMSQVGIRRFSSLPHLHSVLLPQTYNRCRHAGDEAFDSLLRDCKQIEPNDAKDMLYFAHRLQNYLGPAAYYKRILFKQIDPLLCDEILDFMRLVPRSMRFEKAILYGALHHLNPQLARIPYATHSGLESWADETAGPGPVRAYLETQVNDAASEIWTIFDRTALSAQINGLNAAGMSPASGLLDRARKGSKNLMTAISPKATAELVARRAQSYLPGNVLIMRFIVLKYWLDELLP